MIRALNGRLGIKSYIIKMMSGSDKINQKIDFFAQIILSSAFFSSSFVALYQLFSWKQNFLFLECIVQAVQDWLKRLWIKMHLSKKQM